MALTTKAGYFYAVFALPTITIGSKKKKPQKWIASGIKDEGRESKDVADIWYGKELEKWKRNKHNPNDHLPRNASWPDFCTEYLDHSRTNKKKSTNERDKQVIDIFNEHCPISTVQDFTHRVIERYKTKRKDIDGVEHSTINRDLNTLKHMGTIAVKYNYLTKNPGEGIENLKTGKSDPYWWKMNELKAIAAELHTDRRKVAFALGIWTGFRADEICHLSKSDIDFKGKVVKNTAKEGWEPKDYEEREVPLFPWLAPILKKWMSSLSTEWLFETDGKPTNPRFIEIPIKRAIVEAKCKGSFHTTRHTFASWLVSSGVDLYVVSKWLGHASIKTTEIYAHLLPSKISKHIKKLPKIKF